MLENRVINNAGLLGVTALLTVLGVSSKSQIANYAALAVCGLGIYNTIEIRRLEAYQDSMVRLRHKKTALMLCNYLEQPITERLSLTEEQQRLYVDIARLGLATGKEPVTIIQEEWGVPIEQGALIWQHLLPDVTIGIPGM